MKTLKLMILACALTITNCSSLNIVDPTKEIPPQIPPEKSIFFLKVNINAPERIRLVTIRYFDILNSEISGHTLELLGSDNANDPNTLSGCFLFTGKKTVYSLNEVEILTATKIGKFRLSDKKSWFVTSDGSKNPIFAGTLSFVGNKLEILDSGFKECKDELSKKYPKIDLTNSEELLRKKDKTK
ncbi:hypothetical protein P3G55_02180 [Leptospira sp. 96542]|nr:hypothetical protein [Leptospira sp. 96542]